MWIETYSDKYHEERRRRVGASDMPAICGVNPYRQPSQVWHDKTMSGDFERPAVNTRAWWGHEVEKSIIKTVIDSQWQTYLAIESGNTWLSPDGPYLASPDAVGYLPGSRAELVEAKMVGSRTASAWSNGPPMYVLAQVHAQMAFIHPMTDGEPYEVTGAHVGAMIGGDPVQSWYIPYDSDVADAMCGIASAFLEKFPSYKDNDWDDYVRTVLTDAGLLPPVREFQTRPVDLADMATIMEHRHVANELKELKRRKSELDGDVRALFGDDTHDALADDAGNIVATRTQVTKRGYDLAALQAEHPGLLAKYRTTSTYQRVDYMR